MPNFDRPDDTPKENNLNNPIKAGSIEDNDFTPKLSENDPSEIIAGRAQEEMSLEDKILSELKKGNFHNVNTVEMLSEWENIIREKLYLEHTGKVKNIDTFVHDEFKRLENEFLNQAVEEIESEEERKRLIHFIEEKNLE